MIVSGEDAWFNSCHSSSHIRWFSGGTHACSGPSTLSSVHVGRVLLSLFASSCFRPCPNQLVISCCPLGFLRSSCFCLLCSSCTTKISCVTFNIAFAHWAMICYASSSVFHSSVHWFFDRLSISRTACMRVIIPLLRFPTHARAASVHVRSLWSTPVRS